MDLPVALDMVFDFVILLFGDVVLSEKQELKFRQKSNNSNDLKHFIKQKS